MSIVTQVPRLSGIIDRLFQRTEIQGNHWLWLGAKTDGYGQVRVEGTKYWLHRWSYMTFIAPAPSGYHVHHTCPYRACWNPWCLQLLTTSKHMSISAKKEYCKRGHSLAEHGYIRRDGTGRACKVCMQLKRLGLV